MQLHVFQDIATLTCAVTLPWFPVKPNHKYDIAFLIQSDIVEKPQNPKKIHWENQKSDEKSFQKSERQ